MPRKTVIIEKNEIKLYLLYLFRLLERQDMEVDFDTLSEIVMWEGAVNHFDFSQAFSELLAAGSIDTVQRENGVDLHKISGKGTIIIDNMADVLIADVRDNAMRSLMRFISYKRDGSVYTNKITEEGSGWRIKCALTAGGKDIVSISIYSDNRQYLEKISIRFSENAEKIINSTVGIVAGDVDFLF